jgi:hypothetical protein
MEGAMLDELREQADQTTSLEDDDEEEATAYFRMRYQSDEPFLGMTAGQRLVIAILFLFMTVILSTFCLLITERITPF